MKRFSVLVALLVVLAGLFGGAHPLSAQSTDDLKFELSMTTAKEGQEFFLMYAQSWLGNNIQSVRVVTEIPQWIEVYYTDCIGVSQWHYEFTLYRSGSAGHSITYTGVGLKPGVYQVMATYYYNGSSTPSGTITQTINVTEDKTVATFYLSSSSGSSVCVYTVAASTGKPVGGYNVQLTDPLGRDYSQPTDPKHGEACWMQLSPRGTFIVHLLVDPSYIDGSPSVVQSDDHLSAIITYTMTATPNAVDVIGFKATRACSWRNLFCLLR